MPKRGLGKGLSAIIDSYQEIVTSPQKSKEYLKDISISQIESNPYQPRKRFDESALKELADSIKSKGLIQPIVVAYEEEKGKYILISGERRLRACKLLGYASIKAIVVPYKREEFLEIALIENIQREGLTPIEEALGYRELIDRFGYTHEQIASIIGKDRATITNTLRLLKLPDEIKEMLNDGLISAGHCRVLLGLDDEKLQIELAKKIVEKKISVRETEQIVKRLKSEKSKVAEIKYQKPSFIREIEKSLQEIFATKVSISGSDSKGKIEIYYHSKEELDNILEFFSPIKGRNGS
jgi:ParB family chromosome partitioning protein